MSSSGCLSLTRGADRGAVSARLGHRILARMLSDQLSRKWIASVITENVRAHRATSARADVFRAAPDGHTLMLLPARADRHEQVLVSGHGL